MTTNNDLAPIKPAAALAPMSIKDTVLAQFKEAEADLSALAERYRNVAYDTATPKGMKEAIAARADVRDNGRLLVTRSEKRIKADVNDLKRVMSDEVERLVAIVKPVEDAIDKQIKAEEDRKAAEKAKREQAEAERTAKHRENIDKIKSYVTRAQGQPIEAIEKAIASLSTLTIGEEWEEFADEASRSLAATIDGLKKLVDSERQRLENERLAKELEAAKAALAEAERRQKAVEDAQAPPAEPPAAAQAAEPVVGTSPAPWPVPVPPKPEPEAAPAPAEHQRHAGASLRPEQAAPAPDAPPSKSFADLSDDEMQALIDNGGTRTLGRINTLLAKLALNASNITDLGIATRKYRGAVHIEASQFTALCNALIVHVQGVRDTTTL